MAAGRFCSLCQVESACRHRYYGRRAEGRLVWHGMGSEVHRRAVEGIAGCRVGKQTSVGCADGQMARPGPLVMPMCDCAD